MTLGRVAVELQLGAVSSTIRIDTQRVYSMYLYIPYVAHGGRHSGFFFSFLFFSFLCVLVVLWKLLFRFKEKRRLDIALERESYARPIKRIGSLRCLVFLFCAIVISIWLAVAVERSCRCPLSRQQLTGFLLYSS